MALAKPGMEHDGLAAALGNRLRGFGGAAQVARHEDVEGLRGQARRDRARLRAALGGEVAIPLALDSRLDIPLGLPVAHHDDAGQYPRAQWRAASAFTSSCMTDTRVSSSRSLIVGPSPRNRARLSQTIFTAASSSQRLSSCSFEFSGLMSTCTPSARITRPTTAAIHFANFFSARRSSLSLAPRRSASVCTLRSARRP